PTEVGVGESCAPTDVVCEIGLVCDTDDICKVIDYDSGCEGTSNNCLNPSATCENNICVPPNPNACIIHDTCDSLHCLDLVCATEPVAKQKTSTEQDCTGAISCPDGLSCIEEKRCLKLCTSNSDCPDLTGGNETFEYECATVKANNRCVLIDVFAADAGPCIHAAECAGDLSCSLVTNTCNPTCSINGDCVDGEYCSYATKTCETKIAGVDLEVSELTTSTLTPGSGDTITVDVVVQNIGTTKAECDYTELCVLGSCSLIMDCSAQTNFGLPGSPISYINITTSSNLILDLELDLWYDDIARSLDSGATKSVTFSQVMFPGDNTISAHINKLSIKQTEADSTNDALSMTINVPSETLPGLGQACDAGQCLTGLTCDTDDVCKLSDGEPGCGTDSTNCLLVSTCETNTCTAPELPDRGDPCDLGVGCRVPFSCVSGISGNTCDIVD
ncbi:MAG: hypothetical protein GOV15_03340, partial [Candidatus Diapherotrites archaeon]|nr:hypothetical protein [Candidatus Diapherotrites archaeon]